MKADHLLSGFHLALCLPGLREVAGSLAGLELRAWTTSRCCSPACSSTTGSSAPPRSGPSATGLTARCCGWAIAWAFRCRCRLRIRSTRCRLLRLALACGSQGMANRYVCETIFRHVWRGGADAGDAQRLQALRQSLQPARDPAGEDVKAELKAQHRRGDRARRIRRADLRRGRQAVLGPGRACPCCAPTSKAMPGSAVAIGKPLPNCPGSSGRDSGSMMPARPA